MAITYERKIDALGGDDHLKSADWNNGYRDALDAATEIGADADTMIGELIEALEDIIFPGPYATLSKVIGDAETLIRRIKARTV